MRRLGTVTMAAAALGVAALAGAQTSPGPDKATRVAVPSARSVTCTGFDDVNDCLASLHAAQNLGIPFDTLKAKVTGGRKLRAAIHDLKPGVDAESEARRAEEQAKADLHSPQG